MLNRGIVLSKILMVISSFIILLGLVQFTHADFEATSTLTATQATYVDPNQASTNLDNGLLFVSVGSGNPGQRSLIKFDLSGVGFVINKARLNVAVINDNGASPCFTTSNALSTVRLFSYSDSWSETVTFSTLPAAIPDGGTALTATFNGPINTGPGHNNWEDTTGGAGSLVEYLENQRIGDGIATLWVAATSGNGTAVFEDNEGTGASAGCAGADLVPTLQLADSNDPLSVDLLSTEANLSQNNLLWIGIVMLIIAISLSLLLTRKRSAR